MRAMPYLQIVNGKYRVRIVGPPEPRPYLPPPHTGKTNLTRAFGTGNEREANRLAVAWIADFQAAITSAQARQGHHPPLHQPQSRRCGTAHPTLQQGVVASRPPLAPASRGSRL